MLGLKETIMRSLLHNYDVDVEPPLASDTTNTTVKMWLNLLCATPLADKVSIEGWLVMVRSRDDRGNGISTGNWNPVQGRF